MVKKGGTTLTFVTDGVHSALERGQAAAGGGPPHTRAVGDGTRLFEQVGPEHVELEVTHLGFRVHAAPRRS